ncbi:MAG: helix-turn-helix transcriptional regulator [Acidimicrobiales bacterium]
MRADRLVAILLMFQLHGRLTAVELAERLETSERTVRRDLDALCMAGVPLHSQRGRGGGWTLVGGHRMDLTGLTAEEAHALFLATGPGTSAALGPGVGQGLTAARRKVLAALPEPLRAQVEAAGAFVLIDQSRWGRAADGGTSRSPVVEDPHLAALRSAVLGGVQAMISYEPPGRPAEDRRVQPHGLVCKRGVWYLVATAPGGLRTYRLSRVRSVVVTDEAVEPPAGFDLAEAWAGVQRQLAARMAAVVAEVTVAPNSLRRLRATVGVWWSVEETGAADDGRTQVTIRFPSVAVAASELAALGDHVEVGSPEEVRAEMAEIGRRLASRYGGPARPGATDRPSGSGD